MNEEKILRILIVGWDKSGKTALTRRLGDKSYDEYICPSGMDTFKREVSNITIEIHDSPSVPLVKGREDLTKSWREAITNLYINFDAFIVTYNAVDIDTIIHLKDYLKSIKEKKKDAPIAIVGTHRDDKDLMDKEKENQEGEPEIIEKAEELERIKAEEMKEWKDPNIVYEDLLNLKDDNQDNEERNENFLTGYVEGCNAKLKDAIKINRNQKKSKILVYGISSLADKDTNTFVSGKSKDIEENLKITELGGIIVVYDTNKRCTFEHTDFHLKNIQYKNSKSIPFALVSFQQNGDAKEEVTPRDGKRKADEYEIAFFQVRSGDEICWKNEIKNYFGIQ